MTTFNLNATARCYYNLVFLGEYLLSTSMENREGLIWFDGEFVDWKDANIHILNHGLHYASSVFEGLKAFKHADGTIYVLIGNWHQHPRGGEI